MRRPCPECERAVARRILTLRENISDGYWRMVLQTVVTELVMPGLDPKTIDTLLHTEEAIDTLDLHPEPKDEPVSGQLEADNEEGDNAEVAAEGCSA